MNAVGPDDTGRSQMPDVLETTTTTATLPPAQAQASRPGVPAPASAAAPPGGAQIESFAQPGNDFHYRTSAEGPVGTGTAYDQACQAGYTALLATGAAASVASGGSQPSDETIDGLLAGLGIDRPLPGEPTATADYESTIPHLSPQAAYDAFVQHPERFFAAADLKVRPLPAHGLESGARFMLEDRSIPPVWAPVEVRLDPTHHRIQFVCLDGHPLRGVNEFNFEPDGHGGTKVRQHSEFQGSSAPTTLFGVYVLKALDRQHDIWKCVHGELGKVTR